MSPHNIALRRHSLESGVFFNGTTTTSRQFLAREAGFRSIAKQSGVERSAVEIEAYTSRLLSLALMMDKYHAFLPVRSHGFCDSYNEWAAPTEDVTGSSTISTPFECQPCISSVQRHTTSKKSFVHSLHSIGEVSRACTHATLHVMPIDIPTSQMGVGMPKHLRIKSQMSSRPVTPRVGTDSPVHSQSLTQLYRHMTTRLHQHLQHYSKETFRTQICPVSAAVRSI